MSELILTWLNQQLQLSKRITSFQQDFSNGYLLGQLLSKYNQQLNFAEFLNKDDKKSKLKNFQLLFDTFAALKVTFGSAVANDVINKKNGVAKKLLYELKMNLEKTLSPGGNAFTKMTKMTKTLSPLKKIKVSKEQYDKVDKEHFVKQLNELHPAQKSINQQKLLKKFSDFHQLQKTTNNLLSEKDFDSKLGEQRKFRQRQRDNLKKTADFRNEWERSNVQKWEANMTVRTKENEKDMMFRTKLEQTKMQNKTMSELNAIKSLDKDINEFERKFIKKNNKQISQLKNDSDSSDYQPQSTPQQQPEIKKKESKLQTKLKFPQTTAQFPLSPSKSKKLTAPTQQQKHQRQKKRRKMIVEQNKRYQLIEISRRQKYILSTIQQTSKQQKQLEYEIWRVWQNKEIMKEDRVMLEEKQKEKNQIRQINAKFKREQLLKTYKEEHQAEVADAVQRQQKLTKDHNVGQRKKTYNKCKKIVQQFLSVSQKLFMNQQQRNSEEVSQEVVEHLLSEFIEGVEEKEDIGLLEVKNYVHGLGEWSLEVKRKSEEQPTDPSVDNALPDKVTNNYCLGNILRKLYEAKLNDQGKRESSNEQNIQLPTTPNCLISLLGPQFAGKHIVAQILQKTHNFNIIEIEQLICKKLQQYQQMKDKLSEVSQETRQLVELSYGGKDIPNQLIIALIKEEVKRHQRNVLINFPVSYNQALLLTKQLSGIQPNDFIPKTQFQQRVESFSRLVWPTESLLKGKPIKECGVDLALWIDVSDKTSYDRFLGRRYVDDRVVSVNDEVSDIVGLLKVGDKASPQIAKNYQKLMERQKLEEFFAEFGIVVNAQQQPKEQQEFRQQQQNENSTQINKQLAPITLKSWSTINGHCPIPELQQHALEKVQQTLQAKQLKLKQQQQSLNSKKVQQQQDQKLKQLQLQVKQKCSFTPTPTIISNLSTILSSTTLPKQFITNTTTIWQSTESSTIRTFRQCFQFLQSQSLTQLQYISQTKRNFINLLTREDKKFSLVKKFQIDYNKFIDENKEMISQQYTKEELHQRVDDLEEVLIEIIQEKKKDAVEEKKNCVESGWFQSQCEQFCNVVRMLLQAQLNRFNASQRILVDFYGKKHSVPQLPQQDLSNQQIPYDTTLQITTKDGTCPRLDKLISETLRLFNREEQVVDDKGKKGGKAPPVVKKDDKKGGKKNEPQQVKQPSAEQKQLKRATNTQKSIFRYRVAIISQFSQQKLLSLLKQTQHLYSELQSYYQYTYQVENKTVNQLSKIFREKIELQEKIQNEFQVHYVDVIENQKIRNFQKEKVVVLAAKQQRRDDRMMIENIWHVVELLRNEAQDKQKISTKRLLQLIKHLKSNPSQKDTLPRTWKHLQQHQIQQFIIRIDHISLGYIELWKVLTFIIFSSYIIPTDKILQQYYNELTSFGTVNYVMKEKFISTKAWFDEKYDEVENVRTFMRNQLIKDVLFEVMKDQGGEKQWVDANRLVKCLGLKYWLEIEVKEGVTYFDVAFGDQ